LLQIAASWVPGAIVGVIVVGATVEQIHGAAVGAGVVEHMQGAGEVGGKVGGKVGGEVGGKVGAKVGGKVGGDVGGKVGGKVEGEQMQGP